LLAGVGDSIKKPARCPPVCGPRASRCCERRPARSCAGCWGCGCCPRLCLVSSALNHCFALLPPQARAPKTFPAPCVQPSPHPFPPSFSPLKGPHRAFESPMFALHQHWVSPVTPSRPPLPWWCACQPPMVGPGWDPTTRICQPGQPPTWPPLPPPPPPQAALLRKFACVLLEPRACLCHGRGGRGLGRWAWRMFRPKTPVRPVLTHPPKPTGVGCWGFRCASPLPPLSPAPPLSPIPTSLLGAFFT
jgi:hypothetical protein